MGAQIAGACQGIFVWSEGNKKCNCVIMPIVQTIHGSQFTDVTYASWYLKSLTTQRFVEQ